VNVAVGVQDIALEYKQITVNKENNHLDMLKELPKVNRSFLPLFI
jgi:hypothetical protein